MKRGKSTFGIKCFKCKMTVMESGGGWRGQGEKGKSEKSISKRREIEGVREEFLERKIEFLEKKIGIEIRKRRKRDDMMIGG